MSTGQSSGSHRVIGQPGHIVPSYIMELSEVEAMKFRCPGRNLAWSKEIHVYGEKMKENSLVKVGQSLKFTMLWANQQMTN